MEDMLQCSSKLGYPADGDDSKYISGLSTILVATIQETKDRISQIEYVFCNQLYPNFQSKSNSLQKIYFDAKKEAEEAFKKKESDLLVQIERLQLEKQGVIEENQSLKLEKERLLMELGKRRNSPVCKASSQQIRINDPDEELPKKSNQVDETMKLQQRLEGHEGKITELLSKVKSLEENAEELEEELLEKSQEVDDGMKIHKELLQMIQAKACMIAGKDKQLQEREENTNDLLAKVKSLEEKVEELKLELLQKSKKVDERIEFQKSLFEMLQQKDSMIADKRKQLEQHEKKTNKLIDTVKSLEEEVEDLKTELEDKTEEIARERAWVGTLVGEIDRVSSKLKDSELLVTEHEKEKQDLLFKVGYLEGDVEALQDRLQKKTQEIEEGKLLQAQLFQQIDMNAVETLKQKQQLEESDNDRKRLLDKVSGLEKQVIVLQENLSSSGKVAEGKNSYENLIQQIELKTSELLAASNNYRELMNRYKRLKSQYNFLLTRNGLTAENMLPQNKVGDGSGLKHLEDPTTSHDCPDNRSSDASGAAFDSRVKIERECSDGLEADKSISTSGFKSPASGNIPPKCPPTVRSAPTIGTKRPASRWVDTRSRQCKDGPDPHDNFLDTPLENFRGNLNKAIKEEAKDLHIPVQKDINLDHSDDETQDMNVDPSLEKQKMSAPMAGKQGFKYVEPVRKKAERENLKGVECKQCKKFYDAVLPDGSKGIDGSKQNLRCEHHDGVSRHRYKYAPPSTPEGFWNIGFESEM